MSESEQNRSKSFRAPPVPVGWPIHHYPHADRNEKPCGAIVLQVTNEVGLKLLQIPDNNAAKPVSGVRHLSDPFLETCDHANRCQRGAWDYIPGGRPIDETLLKSLVAAEIARLLESGQISDQIVETLKKKK